MKTIITGLEEIRKTRHEISAKCGHDVKRFFARMRKLDEKFKKNIADGKNLISELPGTVRNGKRTSKH